MKPRLPPWRQMGGTPSGSTLDRVDHFKYHIPPSLTRTRRLRTGRNLIFLRPPVTRPLVVHVGILCPCFLGTIPRCFKAENRDIRSKLMIAGGRGFRGEGSSQRMEGRRIGGMLPFPPSKIQHVPNACHEPPAFTIAITIRSQIPLESRLPRLNETLFSHV